MALVILVIVGLIVLSVFLFVTNSPQFGGKMTKEQKERYVVSPNYKDGKFVNTNGADVNLGFGDMMKSLKGYFFPLPKTIPEHNISVEAIDSVAIADYVGPTRLIWFGHSTFLLQSATKNILIDPMFGEVPAPNSMLGTSRFSKKLPIEIDQLPSIDAVVFSHDHYDHLDYGSVLLLKDKVNKFITPLGLGVHLTEWGVEQKDIVELDWWNTTNYLGMEFICTPAQHFSGRGISDRGNTLWSSWVINLGNEKIFFSGDSGYGSHFQKIGDKFGPFDFAMMECGQYNELWKAIHMMPEETAQASIDVRAKRMMPIHWGAFKLAMHPWTEPIERVSIKAKELGVDMIAPKIGQPIYLDKPLTNNEQWWLKF
ncbi:L-ascorbate metabolism protein UlaG, beta-lactamase superfamily [Maribacter sedimenticola]|uniref:L-ascorbate metabolism protein UlaG, beta-lactamase superfamily n=2 Tax=Maribacter sedimenticola TaxID=228956 RepID=A0ABY1SI53_9FLAO|nr:L-ascorbate metabolism protein UlaG, beta-lactamase superfamily [Maribacter sedimenticola]